VQKPNKLLHSPSKHTVLSLLNSGDINLAHKEAEFLINKSPFDCEIQYAFGLSCLMKNEVDKAILWLKKAVKQKPKDPIFNANLGVSLQRNKDLSSAIKYLKKAVKLNPEYDNARYNLGSAYIENRQTDLALVQYRMLSKKHPENMDYLCAIADSLRESSQWQQSIALYQEVISKDSSTVRAHINLGLLMLRLGKTDQAIEHCKKVIELTPEDITPHKNLGDCYLQIEKIEEAMDSYANAYDIDTNSTELCTAIGSAWLEVSDYVEASSWYQKAITLDEDNLKAHCGLADIVRDTGNIPLSLKNVLTSLSDALWDDGDAQTALEHLETIQALQPGRLSTHIKIGNIHASSGNVENALSEYYTILEQNPLYIPALNGIATSQRGKLDPSHLKTMESLLENKNLQAGSLSSLHNALAYYYDANKQPETSAKHMKKSNRYQWEYKSKRGWTYNSKSYEEHITQLINIYTPEYFECIKDLGNPDETPVFIVAMPRSGTTLTEQILSRHKKVLGIGERNFADNSFAQFTINENNKDQDLSSLLKINKNDTQIISQHYLNTLKTLKDKSNKLNATRIIDKMPDNYSLIGWILTLFPNAKIIHVKRNVHDVALSCWMTQFGAIQWACNEEHLYERINQYQRIMKHWHKVIPDRFIEINYEDLVTNQEEESKRLIEYINLDWDKNCLRFYESDRIIRTASITQVRQPIYKKSVNRSTAYKEHIKELFDNISI